MPSCDLKCQNDKQNVLLKIRIKACGTVIIHTWAGYGK